jgi:hypothetical protein
MSTDPLVGPRDDLDVLGPALAQLSYQDTAADKAAER